MVNAFPSRLDEVAGDLVYNCLIALSWISDWRTAWNGLRYVLVEQDEDIDVIAVSSSRGQPENIIISASMLGRTVV